MPPLVAAFTLFLITGGVFVPTFIVALVMLRAPLRAFTLSATFTIGAFAGILLSLLGTGLIHNRAQPEWISTTLLVFYLTAAGVAGGVLAVFLLGKLSKQPPWRR
jgi:hypothetical protein